MRPPTDAGLGRPFRAFVILLAAGSLTLAACGGGDDDDAGGTTSSTADTTPSTDASTTTAAPNDTTSAPSTTEDPASGAGVFSGLEEVASDLGQVSAIDVDADGTLWVTESNSSTLFAITDDEPVPHYVGEQTSTDPESAMSGLAVAPDGMIWFATRKGIHRLDPATDAAEVVVPAAATELTGPIYWLAVGSDGVVYVGDAGARKLYRVDGAALVHVAGTGESPTANEGTGDGGPAVDATFGAIRDIAVDDEGNIYVGDDYGQRVRRIAPDGTIDSVLGGGSVPFLDGAELAGDGTPAADLDMESPTAVHIIDGELYVSDVTLAVVVRVDADGAYHLVLPRIEGAGSVQQLAATDADTVYVATPDVISRLTS